MHAAFLSSPFYEGFHLEAWDKFQQYFQSDDVFKCTNNWIADLFSPMYRFQLKPVLYVNLRFEANFPPFQNLAWTPPDNRSESIADISNTIMMTISSILHHAFGRCTSSDNILCGQEETRSPNALVSHRFDRPMRCIIDPPQVVKMIKYQGGELIRQAQAQNTNDSVDTPPLQSISKDGHNDLEMWEVESSFHGTEYSFAARTDVTTATGATRVVANRDRYSPSSLKKKRSKAEQFRVLEQIKGPRVDIGSKQNMFYDDSSAGSSIVAEPEIKISKKDLPPGVQLNEGGCGIAFAVCATDELAGLRKEYDRALHLKMKAQMGNFFCGQYLKQFPDSPIPDSLELTRSHSSRSLNPTSTDDSAVLLNVNYGDYVHSNPIHMMVDDSDFMDLGITGSLGLVKRFEVNASGQRLKSPNHYKVLLNRRSGVPLAVCALKSPYGSPVVRIFAVKQRIFGQKPAATTKHLGLAWCDPYPLYAWAEFSMEGEFPNPVRYSMYMSSGADGCFETEPSYRAFHRTIGSPELLVMGRTETERELRGCALISLQQSTDGDDHHFAVSVSRGIDPALILCLASIVDETMENDMRLKCKLVSGKSKLLGGGISLPQLRRPGKN